MIYILGMLDPSADEPDCCPECKSSPCDPCVPCYGPNLFWQGISASKSKCGYIPFDALVYSSQCTTKQTEYDVHPYYLNKTVTVSGTEGDASYGFRGYSCTISGTNSFVMDSSSCVETPTYGVLVTSCTDYFGYGQPSSGVSHIYQTTDCCPENSDYNNHACDGTSYNKLTAEVKYVYTNNSANPPINVNYTESWAISNEYTTDMLKSNVLEAVSAYSGDPKDGSVGYFQAYAHLSSDERSYSVTKLRYQFGVTVPSSNYYKISWVEQFTSDVDGTITNTQKSWTMPAGNTVGTIVYSDIFTIDVPSTNGTTQVVNVWYTCKSGYDPTGQNQPA